MTKGKGRNPGAGNLNKHVKRKVHQERSQPAYRKHLGALEKQKDHALRGKKRRVKQEKLLKLKREAAQRNPDEYHIGMTKMLMDSFSGRITKRRVSLSKKEKERELKENMTTNNRNLQYLQFKADFDRQRAKDLLDEDVSTAITTNAPKNKHEIFVESEEEFKKFNPLKYFDATSEIMKQHPAVRGTVTIMQNTVLPEEVLLGGGHHLKSSAQRRKERKEIQLTFQKNRADDPQAREEIVNRLKAKKELHEFRFTDLVDDVAAAAKSARSGEENEEEDQRDEVVRLLEWKKEKEKEDGMMSARRIKEVAQRMERCKSLNALEKTVKRQNVGIKKQLNQRKDSRFKPGISRRSR